MHRALDDSATLINMRITEPAEITARLQRKALSSARLNPCASSNVLRVQSSAGRWSWFMPMEPSPCHCATVTADFSTRSRVKFNRRELQHRRILCANSRSAVNISTVARFDFKAHGGAAEEASQASTTMMRMHAPTYTNVPRTNCTAPQAASVSRFCKALLMVAIPNPNKEKTAVVTRTARSPQSCTLFSARRSAVASSYVATGRVAMLPGGHARRQCGDTA